VVTVQPPPSLLSQDLSPLWAAVRDRLERKGSASRGRLHVVSLSTAGRQILSSLLGRKLTATIDLSALEHELVRVGAGLDLVDALDRLGHAMSFDQELRRADRVLRKQAREEARQAIASWPEDWAKDWVEEIIQAGLLRGLEPETAVEVVVSVRRCLNALATPEQPRSRVELAALVLGDSHALDPGTRLGAAVARALRQVYASELYDDTDRSAWDYAGVPSDTVSAPALTWNLPVTQSNSLAPMFRSATSLGSVVHVSQMALRASPLEVAPNTTVLFTENPRVVEEAARRRSPLSVASTNGNPSTAVRLLVSQLLASGAILYYHGDFDAAGLAICRRMEALGLRPWHMDVCDYERAVGSAAAAEVDLPLDTADPGSTPWDEPLREVFKTSRRVVHEERLLDELLA
jgi:uncharacterized protein (TIGR02679 family)